MGRRLFLAPLGAIVALLVACVARPELLPPTGLVPFTVPMLPDPALPQATSAPSSTNAVLRFLATEPRSALFASDIVVPTVSAPANVESKNP